MTMMSKRSRTRHALHVVRCTAMATPGRLAARLGRDGDALQADLDVLAAAGLLVRRRGAMDVWSVTPAGREADAAALRDELADSGRAESVRLAYQRFEALNDRMLRVCNDWQVRGTGGEPVPNTHDDAEYDADVLARLRALHAELRDVLDDLASALPRFGAYWSAFDAAMARIDAGQTEYVTGVRVDSYHTIWFELHEDLLTTLGISREDAAGSRLAAEPW